MHRRLACAGAMIVTLLPYPAAAQVRDQPASAPTAKANASDAKSEQIVCRRLVVSGSRMPKRVCATRAEWNDLTKRASEALEGSQQDSDRRSFIVPDDR